MLSIAQLHTRTPQPLYWAAVTRVAGAWIHRRVAPLSFTEGATVTQFPAQPRLALTIFTYQLKTAASLLLIDEYNLLCTKTTLFFLRLKFFLKSFFFLLCFFKYVNTDFTTIAFLQIHSCRKEFNNHAETE